MTTILMLGFALLALGVVALMAYQYLTGRNDLLSMRNFFLLGFIIFQLTSAIFPLLSQDYGQYPLSEVTRTATKFLLWAVVFLVVLLWSYKWGFGVRRLASITPAPSAPPGSVGLLFLALGFTILAIPMRLGLAIPLFSVLTNYIGIGMAAVACGLLGWVWGPRLLNPVMLFPALPLLAINAANVVTGSFGRRALVAIGAGLIWGMYFSRWRYLKPRSVMWRLGLVAAVPVLLLILFTSARSSKEHDRSAVEHLQAIQQIGNLQAGVAMILDGQGTASTSMWLMENFPESFEYKHLSMLQYFFYYPVPRTLWLDKPTPLSGQIANLSRRQNVDRDSLTIGPGILGHAAVDGGWYALILYAFVMGLFLRYFDELLALHATNAMMVMPIGCALGQVLGLARGETSAFAFILVFTVVTVYLFMLVGSYVMRTTGLTRPSAGSLGWDDEEYETDAPQQLEAC